VQKLRPECVGLSGNEIKRRRQAGDTETFYTEEQPRFAYATDTLPEVLDHTPELADVDTLVLECTFLDDRKTLAGARAGCHIHLDELLPRLSSLRVKDLVLMHFSQIYHPDQVRRILAERLPADLPFAVHAFAPEGGRWWN
jgi:ribonuclease Z